MLPVTPIPSLVWYRVAATAREAKACPAVGAADERLDLAVAIFSQRIPLDIAGPRNWR